MKKALSLLAIVALSLGTVNAYAQEDMAATEEVAETAATETMDSADAVVDSAAAATDSAATEEATEEVVEEVVETVTMAAADSVSAASDVVEAVAAVPPVLVSAALSVTSSRVFDAALESVTGFTVNVPAAALVKSCTLIEEPSSEVRVTVVPEALATAVPLTSASAAI